MASELTTTQTGRLVRITAALAEAVAREQVFQAIVEEAAAALGASSAGLFELDPEQGKVRLVHALGYSEQALLALESVPLDQTPTFPALDCIRTGEPCWFSSQQELLKAYPHLGSIASRGRSYQVACLPIAVEGRILGSIGFTFDDAPLLGDEQKNLLLLVARYSGQVLERQRLLEENIKERQRTELLYGLARQVIEAERIDQVFEAALDVLARALSTPRAAILLFDAALVMRFRAWRGLSDEYRQAVEGHSPWPREGANPEPIFVRDTQTDPTLTPFRDLFRREQIGSLGFIPLLATGRLVGKFMVYYDRPRQVARHELDLSRAIANHVAAAVARFAAMEELQRTVHFNEMFTAVLGHDLRNPLGAIMMAAQLAMSRGANESVAQPLHRILKSGGRMVRMIDQLLDFTRVRMGGSIPIDPRPLDLVPLLRQVIDELSGVNPEWSLRLEPRGDTTGNWDPDRLSQVFSNLVANAIQYGRKEQGVLISVDGGEPASVRVRVHNMGCIPPELLPNLFEPLAGRDRRHRSGGLGLGLYITREIIGAHAGSIGVHSDETDGTTFTACLPRERSHP